MFDCALERISLAIISFVVPCQGFGCKFRHISGVLI